MTEQERYIKVLCEIIEKQRELLDKYESFIKKEIVENKLLKENRG